MLKIRFLSLNRLYTLNHQERLELILGHIKDNDIIIIDGRLKSRDEADLIRRTMSEVSEKFDIFHGIEMASLHDNIVHSKKLLDRISPFKKPSMGITIIGPAAIIEEMEQHSDHVNMTIKGAK